jgi:hypothetical protein
VKRSSFINNGLRVTVGREHLGWWKATCEHDTIVAHVFRDPFRHVTPRRVAAT